MLIIWGRLGAGYKGVTQRSGVRSPFGKMNHYVLVLSFLRSGSMARARCWVSPLNEKFSGKWGMECLNTKLSLLYAGYSVKLIKKYWYKATISLQYQMHISYKTYHNKLIINNIILFTRRIINFIHFSRQ